jgi:hypothetical protein
MLAHKLPYPPRTGDNVRAYHIARHLLAVVLVCLVRGGLLAHDGEGDPGGLELCLRMGRVQFQRSLELGENLPVHRTSSRRRTLTAASPTWPCASGTSLPT